MASLLQAEIDDGVDVVAVSEIEVVVQTGVAMMIVVVETAMIVAYVAEMIVAVEAGVQSGVAKMVVVVGAVAVVAVVGYPKFAWQMVIVVTIPSVVRWTA